MRLGDLDALKEDFKSRLANCNEWIEKAKDKETKIRANAVKSFICEVIMTIDNAPTIENDYEWGYSEGVHDTERPQGEWVIDNWGMYHCNHCMKEKQQLFHNFCGNCGADMRPKANQLRDCENCIHHSDNGCEVWDCEFEKRSDL